MIQLLQILSGLCWLLPFAVHVPAVMRLVGKRARNGDPVKAAFWFTAALQVGFVSRWLLFPGAVTVMSREEIIVWAGLYVLSALCGLAAATVTAASRE